MDRAMKRSWNGGGRVEMSEGIVGIGERRGMAWRMKEIRGDPLLRFPSIKLDRVRAFERDYNDS